MGYELELSPNLVRKIHKFSLKDPSLMVSYEKKVEQIVSSDENGLKHYKNLKGDMCHIKRVHIGHFVLLFTVSGNRIIFKDLVHHDDAYD